jgi:hypothetical protein
LLEKGANLNSENKYGWTPLHIATLVGQEKIVKLLIENGANLNSQNYFGTPLHYAAFHGKDEIVKLIVENGANLNNENMTETHEKTKLRNGTEKKKKKSFSHFNLIFLTFNFEQRLQRCKEHLAQMDTYRTHPHRILVEGTVVCCFSQMDIRICIFLYDVFLLTKKLNKAKQSSLIFVATNLGIIATFC